MKKLSHKTRAGRHWAVAKKGPSRCTRIDHCGYCEKTCCPARVPDRALCDSKVNERSVQTHSRNQHFTGSSRAKEDSLLWPPLLCPVPSSPDHNPVIQYTVETLEGCCFTPQYFSVLFSYSPASTQHPHERGNHGDL